MEVAHLRKLFHLATGLGLTFFLYWLDRPGGMVLVGGLFAVSVSVELLRLQLPILNGLFLSLFGPLLKAEEAARPTGVGYFLGGILICLFFFPLDICLASLVILATGDPAAALIGKKWGRIRIGPKSLEGAAGFLALTLLAGFLFQGWWPDIPILAFAAGALVGAVVECLPLRIDDNLMLPVTSAVAIQTAMRYF